MKLIKTIAVLFWMLASVQARADWENVNRNANTVFTGTTNHFTGDVGIGGALGFNTATGTVMNVGSIAGNGAGLTNYSGWTITNQLGTVSYANSTAEDTVFQASLPPALMPANGGVYLQLGGMLTNGSGGNVAIRIRAYLGTTLMWDTGNSSSIASLSSMSRTMGLNLFLKNLNSTSAQALNGFGKIGHSGASAGSGSINAGVAMDITAGGTAAEDTTSAKVFKVTYTMSSTAASVAWTNHVAILKVL